MKDENSSEIMTHSESLSSKSSALEEIDVGIIVLRLGLSPSVFLRRTDGLQPVRLAAEMCEIVCMSCASSYAAQAEFL